MFAVQVDFTSIAMNISSVLCVCTGNICRSPLAERLLGAALPAVTVESAGIGALQGSPMDPAAAAIARREGFTDEHEGRQLTQAMVRDFELILVMEADQKAWIESRYRESRGRVFMASHWQGGGDIEDPFRLSEDVFETVYGQLAACMDDWRQRLSL